MTEILFQPLGNPLAASRPMEKIADIDSRLTRTHYFDGRLLTAEDLERDQVYLDERLREAGKILGEGIASGLELSFDRYSGLLTLEAGVGVTRHGRILQLDQQLTVNVTDNALISQQNKQKHRRFNRGLYAVTLNYVEVATDRAEVIPTDLNEKRVSEYADVTEALQLGLVPLPLPLIQQSELHARASLIRALQDNKLMLEQLPGDALPLGILAIRDDTPVWLDSELLRHPTRRNDTDYTAKQDLYRQHENLFYDILEHRESGGLSLDFSASDYFSVMPAAGSMPKACVDPERAVQSYFPDHYQVHIAPVRMAEVELLLQESSPLPTIDLTSGDTVDIMILVPLSNQNYGRYAAQLERPANIIERKLKAFDPLRLTIYPRPAPHEIDTDEAVWRAIFNATEDDTLLYVRRPLRAAETQVSGIVLANGFDLPKVKNSNNSNTTATTTESVSEHVMTDGSDISTNSPVDRGGVIADEDEIIKRFLDLKSVAKFRMPQTEAEKKALLWVAEKPGQEVEALQQIIFLLLRISSWFDPVLWRTIRALFQKDLVEKAQQTLFENESGHPVITAKLLVQLMADNGVNKTLLKQWEELAAKLEKP
ncbi:MAG: hypothetical protein VYB48_00860 [Pseudomonadota bacterium]|nr:hypothetical protein [Pseudomonadota bacterium]